MGRLLNVALHVILRLLQLVALIAVGFGIPLAVAALITYRTSESISTQQAVAAVTGGTFVLILLLFGCLTALLIFLVRAVAKLFNKLKSSTESEVVAFAIAVLFFPSAIAWLFVTPFYFASNLLRRGTEISGSAARSVSNPSIEEIARLIAQAGLDLLSGIGNELSGAASLPNVRQLILAGVTWTLLAQLLRWRPVATQDGGVQAGWATRWNALSLRQRRLTGLLVLFFIGAYLAIASIAAIPALETSPIPEALTAQKLRERWAALVPDAVQFDQKFPADPPQPKDSIQALTRELDSIKPLIARLPDSVNRIYINDLNKAIDRTSGVIVEIDDERGELRSEWKTLRDQIKVELGTAQSALTGFEASLFAPMSTDDRSEYFQSTDAWFRGRTQSYQAALGNALDWMQAFDRQASQWSVETLSEFQRQRAIIERIPPNSTDQVLNSVFVSGIDMDGWIRNRGAVMRLRPNPEGSPDPPEPGRRWGPFGWIASWLLRTRSFSLALITGMLGFGIFGASIATFIQGSPLVEERETRENQQMAATGVHRDLSNVLIRGVSAAMVIFLAVKGGLAVVATGDQEPNPYVLFFACVVGAVFSDNVWKWASEQLDRKLGKES